jgi:hypothetical protein
VCGTYGVEERCVHGIGGGVLRERDHLEDQVVEGRILLKQIFKEWNGGMDWIDLAQDYGRWRDVCGKGLFLYQMQGLL